MIETAYFATGCFWGAERRFWQMPGVTETAVGYIGGHAAAPTYEQVCTGSTGHAEMVKVVFDNQKITYRRLLEEFFTMHDPTSLNRQGGDIGSQYRSAVYFTNDNQREAIESGTKLYAAALAAGGHGPIVTEVLSADGMTFWPAEEYHQRYLEKNPEDVESLQMAVEWIYHLKLARAAARTPADDLARARGYADAYARLKGPQQALVKQWIDYLGK